MTHLYDRTPAPVSHSYAAMLIIGDCGSRLDAPQAGTSDMSLLTQGFERPDDRNKAGVRVAREARWRIGLFLFRSWQHDAGGSSQAEPRGSTP